MSGKPGPEEEYFKFDRDLGAISARLYRVPTSAVPEHQHDVTLFSFLVRGEGREIDDHGREVQTESLSMAYFPPGMRHAHRIVSPSAVLLCAALDSEFLERAGQPDLSRPMIVKSGPAITTLMRIHSEFHATDTASDLILEGLFLVLAGELGRGAQRRCAGDVPPWLRRACALIRECCLDNVSIASISHEVGVHPSHLARAFRFHLGQTPGEYLRAKRLEWAARQVTSTSKPIKQIAEEAGFADVAHFSRYFKSAVGQNPSQFREATRK